MIDPDLSLARLYEAMDKIKTCPLIEFGRGYGSPRPGHPEGTVQAHIEELQVSLLSGPELDTEDYLKLRILIWTHDSFKGIGKILTRGNGVPINDPMSHASIAAAYLDWLHLPELSEIAQFHDELWALFKKLGKDPEADLKPVQPRINRLRDKVTNKRLYFMFVRLDSGTDGKVREDLHPEFMQFISRIESMLSPCAQESRSQ